MAQLLVGLLAIFLALMALLLQRLYSFVPARELKRLAREDDHLAKTLYRAVAYGSSLRVLLWAIVSVGLSVGIILVASQVDLPLGIATVLVLLVLIFAVVPSCGSLDITRGCRPLQRLFWAGYYPILVNRSDK